VVTKQQIFWEGVKEMILFTEAKITIVSLVVKVMIFFTENWAMIV
jgi:hypothetical protein